jgi:hypothetical protein
LKDIVPPPPANLLNDYLPLKSLILSNIETVVNIPSMFRAVVIPGSVWQPAIGLLFKNKPLVQFRQEELSSANEKNEASRIKA